MAILNPVYGLIVPFLFVVTVPLAIFAGITTVLAFSVLIFRVGLVYLDIALHMLPQYLTGHRTDYNLPRGYDSLTSPASPVSSGQTSPSPTHGHRGQTRHRRRRSGGSAGSVGTITPISDNGTSTLHGPLLASSAVLSSSAALDRDYEGIGGWRLDDRDDDWTRINSRLELPLERSSKHHYRSPSGGASTPGEGSYLMMKRPGSKDGSPENGNRGRERKKDKDKATMSPNSSRIRTPTAFATVNREDGYFPTVGSPKSIKKAVA